MSRISRSIPTAHPTVILEPAGLVQPSDSEHRSVLEIIEMPRQKASPIHTINQANASRILTACALR
jgi:hypothetical protein